MDRDRLAQLLERFAPAQPCALVPEIVAWHAVDELPLWEALELELAEKIDAPFFCIAWPGAQAIARHLLDDTLELAGKRVVDVGCGSGVAAIAAARRGARAIGIDVDELACESASALAKKNGVAIEVRVGDGLGKPSLTDDADVVVAADLVYSATQVDAFRARVAAWIANGKRVLLADSGRPFFDACGLVEVSRCDVAVPKIVDGVSTRSVRIYGS